MNFVSIPKRRYAKEQVVAHILTQVFSQRESSDFTRTRHYDLQRFFKQRAELQAKHREWIDEVSMTFEVLAMSLEKAGVVLRNRAIAGSAVLVAWRQKLYGNNERATQYAAFLEVFLHRLKWQVKKGLEVDIEYRYLIDFQRHVTQASVEKPAVAARDTVLSTEFDHWLSGKGTQGDSKYQERTGVDPDAASR